MSVKSVASRFMRRTRSAVAIGVCLVLAFELSLGQGVAPDARAATAVTPIAAAGNPEMLRIATGWFHSLAIKIDGSLWAWGSNDYYQTSGSSLAQFYGAAAVAAGLQHSLALKTDGSVWAWGSDGSGQIGDGPGSDPRVTIPVRISPGQVLTGVKAIAAGHYHSMAIKTDGTLWVWGDNLQTNGISRCNTLGIGTTVRTQPIPAEVRSITGIAAVATSPYHTLVIKTDGSLWAWGCNDSGSLGDGTFTNRLLPVQTMTGVAAVAAGDFHSLALKNDGTLWAWGSNFNGQLGDGTTSARSSPVQVLTGVAAVAAGTSHSLALKTDGTLWAWGANTEGQLGDGTTTPRLTPVQILSEVTAMATKRWHSMALRTDGSLWAWGYNADGNIGAGRYREPLPVQVAGFGPTTQPDFVVGNIELSPSNPVAHSAFSAAVTVTNQGLVAGRPGMLQVWANDSVSQGCAAFGDQWVTLESLAAGASTTVTFDGLPAGPAGPKTFQAFVDSACETEEINDINIRNQSTQAYTVVEYADSEFEVTPSAGANGSISPNIAQTVAHGGTKQFTVTPDPGCTASVGGTCGGTLVGDIFTTNPITANCTVTVSFDCTFCWSCLPSRGGWRHALPQ